MNISRTIKAGLLATSAGLVLCHASAALAQDAAPQADTAQESNNGGLDTIVVTATKRGQASNVQDVPFAVTAFGAAQLEEQHFQTFQSLSYSMPNVQLSQIGTTPATPTSRSAAWASTARSPRSTPLSACSSTASTSA